MGTGMLSAIKKSRDRREYHKKKSREYYYKNKEKCISDSAKRVEFMIEQLRESNGDFIKAAKPMTDEIKKSKKC